LRNSALAGPKPTLVALLALSVCAVALPADNSYGTWRLNIRKSEYRPAPFPFRSLTMTREAADEGIKVTLIGQRQDGQAIRATYTAKYDGTETPVTNTGVPYDVISLKQLNADIFIAELNERKGRYHSFDEAAVSKGGKALTVISFGTQADGREFSAKFVYEKQ
jgi:hypothetical protein